MADKGSKPPMVVSDEAKEDHLELARKQGEAYQEALNEMAQNEADDGGEKRAGDYIVAYAVEKAEGMYHLKDGKLEWQEPGTANTHIEISVRDGADNRFIPGLDVTVAVLDEDGKEVGTYMQPFIWHPWLYHYGRNWEVPKKGKYTLQVHIEPPRYARHDEKNGKRYAEPVDLTFEGVSLGQGKK